LKIAIAVVAAGLRHWVLDDEYIVCGRDDIHADIIDSGLGASKHAQRGLIS
jgi:hypothetical protein